jgi:hypothetical protein
MIPAYEEMLDEAYKKLSSMKVLHRSTLGSINIPITKNKLCWKMDIYRKCRNNM